MHKHRKTQRHHATRHAKHHHTEIMAVVMLFLFSAYVLLLTNTSLSATAFATGSVVYSAQSFGSTGLIAGSNSVSIPLMFVLSLAFLVPVEMWLRKK